MVMQLIAQGGEEIGIAVDRATAALLEKVVGAVTDQPSFLTQRAVGRHAEKAGEWLDARHSFRQRADSADTGRQRSHGIVSVTRQRAACSLNRPSASSNIRSACAAVAGR